MFIDFAQPISLPPYWLNHPEVVRRYEYDMPKRAEVLSVPHACPVKMKWESEEDWWQLPIEPVVVINGKNKIVKRNVLKTPDDASRRGTVKELWSQDDYDISMAGVFISTNGKLPEADLRKLRAYCEARESVEVQSPLFTLFNIRRMAIEDYQFPFTKGLENQMFSIKASSDDFDENNLLIIKK